jgi:hypothetical protein
MRFPSIVLWIVPLLLAASAAFGADFTRAEGESLLAAAPESPRPSFAGRSLAGLDLHALNHTKNCRNDRGSQELRQYDPLEHPANLYRTIILHGRQELRDDV